MVIKIHTPLSDATPADVGAGLNNEMTVNPADLLAALLATGPGTPNALQQAIQALMPASGVLPPFATPAETIAGTATNLIVSPADLTAKLANQPAASTCTDREDVVWNGTILQGAAKHYSFIAPIPRAYLNSVALPMPSIVQVTPDVTITNPSNCRSIRVRIWGGSAASIASVSTVTKLLISSYLYKNGSVFANLADSNRLTIGANDLLTSGGSGEFPPEIYDTLTPGESATYAVGAQVFVTGGGTGIATYVVSRGSIEANTI